MGASLDREYVGVFSRVSVFNEVLPSLWQDLQACATSTFSDILLRSFIEKTLLQIAAILRTRNQLYAIEIWILSYSELSTEYV